MPVALRPYTKTHKSAADLVAHLVSRGLAVADHTRAISTIEEVGYNRLRIYFSSRRDDRSPDKSFYPGVTFDDIIQLYRFDEQLRMLCLGFCSRFEIVFKNAISESLTSCYGAHPYFDGGAFKDQQKQIRALHDISDIFYKKLSSDARAKHYFSRYNPPMIPP